jgi:hypothetical protein
VAAAKADAYPATGAFFMINFHTGTERFIFVLDPLDGA